MNRCPLLLRYKVYNCHYGLESSIDFSTGRRIIGWEEYEKPKYELWNLQLPGKQEFLTDSNGDPLHFKKYEYYAVGDPNPVLITFWCQEPAVPNRTYQLPENYNIRSGYIHLNDIRIELQKYERHCSEWQTYVIIYVK